LDVTDRTFYALIGSGSLLLLGWIVVIVHAKLKRRRWKRSTTVLYSHDVYSYVDATEETNEPSSFACASETSVYLEHPNQETFLVSVPKAQTDKIIKLSEINQLHHQGQIADPHESLSDSDANMKSAGDTSAHAIVSFDSPQRGNLPKRRFTQARRQYLAQANAKDSAYPVTSDRPSYVFHDPLCVSHQQAIYAISQSLEPQRRSQDRHENAASIILSPQFSRSSSDGAVGSSRFALDALASELSNKTTISKSHEVLTELSARLQACGVSSLSDLKGMSMEDVRASVADAQLTPLQFTKLLYALRNIHDMQH
jgi:hypothetical protein